MTRAAVLLAVVGALVLLGRRLRVEPVAPAPTDDVDWENAFRLAYARYLYNPATGVSVSHN